MGCSWSPPPQANPPAPPNPTKGQGQCRGLPSIPSPHRRGLSGSGPSPLGLPSRRSSPRALLPAPSPQGRCPPASPLHRGDPASPLRSPQPCRTPLAPRTIPSEPPLSSTTQTTPPERSRRSRNDSPRLPAPQPASPQAAHLHGRHDGSSPSHRAASPHPHRRSAARPSASPPSAVT